VARYFPTPFYLLTCYDLQTHFAAATRRRIPSISHAIGKRFASEYIGRSSKEETHTRSMTLTRAWITFSTVRSPYYKLAVDHALADGASRQKHVNETALPQQSLHRRKRERIKSKLGREVYYVLTRKNNSFNNCPPRFETTTERQGLPRT